MAEKVCELQPHNLNISFRHFHTSYLSQISQMRYVEKNLSCREISVLYALEMWQNLKFLHMWSNLKFLHMTDVEKSEVSPHLACVWCGECLYIYTCYAVLSKNWFCCDLRRFVAKSVLLRFTHFCVEKNLTKDCICGEKMTNIRYASPPSHWPNLVSFISSCGMSQLNRMQKKVGMAPQGAAWCYS